MDRFLVAASLFLSPLAVAPVAPVGGCDGKESKTGASANTIIGIDLGTTYSTVALVLCGDEPHGRVEIASDPRTGDRVIPSFVAWAQENRRGASENDVPLVGVAAKNQVRVIIYFPTVDVSCVFDLSIVSILSAGLPQPRRDSVRCQAVHRPTLW